MDCQFKRSRGQTPASVGRRYPLGREPDPLPCAIADCLREWGGFICGMMRAFLGKGETMRCGAVELDRGESHHLMVVRRAQVGQTVELLDGRGARGRGVVAEADPRRAVVTVQEVRRADPAVPAVCLALALLKGRTMDWVIQKSTELGVGVIQALATAHSEVHLGAERVESRLEKWQMVAREACKQCGNPHLPAFPPPVQPGEFVQRFGQPGRLGLMGSLLPAAGSLSEVIEAAPSGLSEVWLVIGPEGDFTPQEYQTLAAAGVRQVTLGPLVLRAETAAVAGLGALGEALRRRHSKLASGGGAP